jgi:drug/metabolite transporter superfamily protein YnfA
MALEWVGGGLLALPMLLWLAQLLRRRYVRRVYRSRAGVYVIDGGRKSAL